MIKGGESMELKMKVSKKTWKRWLAAVLSICLCLSCFQTPVLAQGETQSIEKKQAKKKKIKKKSEPVIASKYSRAKTLMGERDSHTISSIGLDEYADVSISVPGEEQWFSFTAPEKGTYYFYSESQIDTYGILYDLNWETNIFNSIYENDDISTGYFGLAGFAGNEYDFCIPVEMEEGQTYYLSTSLYNENVTGDFKIKVSLNNPVKEEINEADVQNAKEINIDYKENVTIQEPGEYKWFKFIPNESGSYIFYSSSTEDVRAILFKYDEETEQYALVAENDDSDMNENSYDFRISSELENGVTYYLCTNMYDLLDTGAFGVTVTKTKKAESVEVKEVKPYSSMLAYRNQMDNSYGQMTFEISYEESDEKREIVMPFGASYGYDIYGNEIEVLLTDSSLETNWRRKYQGDYLFTAFLRTYEYELTDNIDFNRKINSFKDYGKTAIAMSYGQSVSVGSGTQIFEFTAQENGNHVISYSSGLEDSYIYVYNASENRADWKYGDNNTRYGRLIKGNKYYIVVQSYSGDSGTIKLNYYNGATNPNAAPKPSTPSTSTPSSNVPKAPSVSNKSTGIPATGISVAKKSIALKKGGKIKLSTIVSPLNSTDSVTFTSSKPKVANVNSNGVVKAKKPGKAKIIITTTSGKTVTVKVKVTKKAVKATKISVKKKLKIKKGTVSFLSYKVNPKNSTDKMKWKSSKKGIVSVDNNGKITAKKKGKAVITVKIGNKKASCKVTVK